MQKIILLIVFFFLTGVSEDLSAKHIIGGDMYYRCISIDTVRKLVSFRVTLKMYRDCSNAEGALYDPSAKMGIYEKLPNGSFRFVNEIIVLLRTPILSIDPSASNPCLIVPPNVCVQEGIYEFETGFLPIISNAYYIAYQRCCRNETITNITLPGEAGAAFTLEIAPEAQKTCNNSPQFKNFPPVVICVNNPINFDHSVTDMEGDSVVYAFCDPLTAGGQDGTINGMETCVGVKPSPRLCFPPFIPVNFKAPLYTTNSPLSGNPAISIDPVTGWISGVPNLQGQFVVGVCIKEFRKGILLTETRRDFQFNVAFCSPKVFAKLQADSVVNGSDFVINSCGNQTIDFTNLSTDENFISSYKWRFNIQGINEVINTKNAKFTFPVIGTYTGKMILNDGTDCSDSADITVNIFPGLNADYGFFYDTCTAGPIIFRDSSVSGSGNITDWNWRFGNAGTSILENPTFLFSTPGYKQVQLQITDINGCKDLVNKTLPYFPVPPLLVVDPSALEGCTPLKVCFNNLSTPIDTNYTIHWDFGDGKTVNKQISPCHTYNEEGVFSVKLELTSPLGCYTERLYPSLIQVRQSPEADFNAVPDKLTTLDPSANFTDNSRFSHSRQWLFNDTDLFLFPQIEYFFRDTGLQKVSLIAINNNGCTDTLIKYIDVEPKVTLYMPNAFSPNGDSKNDQFLGKGVTQGIKSFQMTIWDRWGMKLFETSNPSTGWNGSVNNSGRELPNGAYVFLVRYLTPRNQWIELKGFATLIR